jgi:hypothetical protein
LVLQGFKFEKEEGNENLKFVELGNTESKKAIFVLGIDNNNYENNNLKSVDKLIENFSPNYFLYEKDCR